LFFGAACLTLSVYFNKTTFEKVFERQVLGFTVHGWRVAGTGIHWINR